MSPTPTSSELFEAQRPRLLGIAYRMVGSLVDAEDIVSDVRHKRHFSVETPGADGLVRSLPTGAHVEGVPDASTPTQSTDEAFRRCDRGSRHLRPPWFPAEVCSNPRRD